MKRNLWRILGYGSCYIIGLIPMLYFYYHTGYINLTASYEGFLIGSETTLQRFAAYLFDLNFGILPYYSIVLVTGFILLVRAVIYKHWRYIEWFLAFLTNVLLYSKMVHINSGMLGIARYNAWGSVLLIFEVCLFFEELSKKEWIRKMIRVGLAVNVVIFVMIACQYYDDGYIRKILASEKDKDILKDTLVSLTDEGWLQNQIDALGKKDTYISIPLKYQVVKRGEGAEAP